MAARDGLLTAGLLLALALLLEARAWEGELVSPGAVSGSDVTSIRAFSTAQGLEPASLGGRPVPDAILIDDLFLRSHPELSGIRVATLSPDRELRGYRSFDVGASDSAVAALLAHLEGQPRDALLVFTTRGAIRPEGDGAAARREALEDLAQRLGAQGRPFAAPRASWALIALRGRKRWVPLAEACAENRPARLAFSVVREPSHYDGWRAELVRN